MSQRPIDYATPVKREKFRISQAEKWTLIVFGLIVAAVITFLVLFFRYLASIGPYDSH